MQFLNPFIPHHPADPKLFIGRGKELARLEASLRHTKRRKPLHFMITGERGIGKTSLLNYVHSMAHSYADNEADALNFIVANVKIDGETTQLDFVRKVEAALRHDLERTESARIFLQKAWAFLQRIEVAGVKIRDAKGSTPETIPLLEEFANTLIEIARKTCLPGDPDALFTNSAYDGILILIDEVDTASEQLRLGSFLKYLTEYIQGRNCQHVMIGLSGLPNMVDLLLRSHPSALRVFEEIRLGMLSTRDVSSMIDTYLLSAEVDNGRRFSMTDEAKAMLGQLAEGHPHFIQQCSYYAFNAADQRIAEAERPQVAGRPLPMVQIGHNDVMLGAFEPRGAIDVIGDIYYREPFKMALADRQVREVLGYLCQFPDGKVLAIDLARAVGIGTARAREILKDLAGKSLVKFDVADETFSVCHRCFAFWLQKSGRGRQITLGELDS